MSATTHAARHERAGGLLPFAAMAAALTIAVLAAATFTPASLLTSPERPYAGYGNPTVRTESPAYPRAATGTDDVRAVVAAAPRRLVSQHWSTDEFLYAVAPPERVVGVSESAYQRPISNVIALAERYQPIVSTDIERVLRADPDLIFTPESSRADTPALFRRAGVPVYRMHTMFETLASIEAHIRLVGYLTGEDGRADHEVRRFRQAIDRAAARRVPGVTPRVMGFGGRYSYGSRTLFSDIVRVLGAENIAATHGLVGYDRVTDEHIARWDPEWIVAGAPRGTADITRRQLLDNPAIAATTAAQRGQIVVLEQHVFLAMSPFTGAFVEALADALYGRAS